MTEFVLIDDNAIDNFLHHKLLEVELQASQVVEFVSAAQALQYLREHKPAPAFERVIFLDLKMPGMDGLQFLAEYHKMAHDQKAGNKIVVLTSSISVQDEQQVQAFPEVVAFLSKPLSQSMLHGLHA